MKKALTIGVAVAAIAAALSLVAADGTERDRVVAAADIAVTPPYYRGPRIIHVPQPGERRDDDERASVDERDNPAWSNDGDDDDLAPPPRRRVEKPKPRAKASTPSKTSVKTPRWKTRSDAPPPPPPPPPTGPRRAVLSAPPPSAVGPTPIRPTPRFDSKAEAGEKFAPPTDTAVTADTPPLGYMPPAMSPPNETGDDGITQ